ncbi:translationally-controlled tumor protein homolog isoform X2 [Mercenaria mercenaria]|uniref:translationally-controlled tumor protein homolog isoform X2 n=1 Tax=Mercenaria mercenaria TaxID=6596 RepID=UPI001E1D6644|nr:translationally-controlled tumor protein homolog isoform X2 [Mercenaria mercenaria]
MLLFADEELFTDAYKLGFEGPDNFLISVEGKLVTRPKGGDISADLIGGNPSQEEQQEGCDEVEMESGIDIVLSQKLTDQSDFFSSKKVLQSYLKKWLKNTADALKDSEQEEKCASFKKDCQAHIKLFLEKWSPDASVFADEKFDPEEAKSSLLIAVWSEDGMGATLYGIREALCDEKC